MPLHRGKIATHHPEILESRPLVLDDIALLREARGPHPTRMGSGHVAKLRHPHHRLARFIAAGLRGQELVERSGYSMARITSLRKDPAFQELVAGYAKRLDDKFIDEQTAYEGYGRSNMVVAQRMISEELDEHDEAGTRPPLRQLVAIVADGGDRFGFPKLRTSVSADAKDFGNLIEQAIARSRSVRTIEVPHSPPASSEPQSTVARESTPALPSPPLAPFLRRA